MAHIFRNIRRDNHLALLHNRCQLGPSIIGFVVMVLIGIIDAEAAVAGFGNNSI